MAEKERNTCEDSDPNCPACHGHCQNEGIYLLFRVDMEDQTGTLFCKKCAEDAFESGLFTMQDPEAA